MNDEYRRRIVEWRDPAELAEEALTMSGLDYLKRMSDGRVDNAPVALLIGFRLVEVEEGRAVFELEPAEHQYNPFGTLHGGVTAGVIDAATGCAVHSTLPKGAGFTSLEIKVNYVRPVTTETGLLRCEGRVVHTGNRIALAEGKVTDGEGKLYAFGVSTIMIFRQGQKK
jgi:uncharacterized protein (TIGR00369 family)